MSGTAPNEETRLYFVRHAHSPYVHGRELERGLSAAGRADAENIRLRLEQENIGIFVSSSYRRAIDTLAPLAESAGQPTLLFEGLQERLVSGSRDLGAAGFLEEKARCYADFDYCPPGGESSRAAAGRAMPVLRELLHNHAGQRIAIGTHGDILTLMLNGFAPEFGFEFWQRLSMPDVYCAFFNQGLYSGVERIRCD
ncbi:histidine phosphatase family protein [Saccharibacillus deserti]|uniref:histidine phosphatase family protein n=1 Tax=Saccharibacillus deserti TaxID=1634444 RepID=UPI00155773CB|nr:histidine phosphatase family protein [Saccharibacillus deserti]